MKKLLCALALILLAGEGWGATIYAKPSTDNTSLVKYSSDATSCTTGTWTDNTDLEAALNAAGASGTLNICAGTYSGTMIDASDGLDSTANGQTINGIGAVIINAASSADHALYVNHTPYIVKNITLSGAPAAGGKYDAMVSKNSTFDNVIFSGGDRSVQLNSAAALTVTFTNSSFINSTNTTYSIIDWTDNVTANFNYCKFEGNAAHIRGYSNSTYTFNNSIFIGHGQTVYKNDENTGKSTTANFNNCIVVGGDTTTAIGGEGKYTIDQNNQGAINITNSILLPSGMVPATKFLNGTITESGNLDVNPKFVSWRRPVIVVFGIDDRVNISHWMDIADYAHATYGFHTTIAVSTADGDKKICNGSTSDWSCLQSRVAQGHEVASHGLSHVDLRTADLAVELQQSKSTIDNGIGSGYSCTSIVYPSGYYNATVIDNSIAYGFLGGREVGATNSVSLEKVPLFTVSAILLSSVVGTDNIARSVNAILQSAGYKGRIIYFLGHTADDYSLANWKTVIDTVAASGARVMTFAEAIAYIKENGTDGENVSCTASGTPFTCCTGSGTGTCEGMTYTRTLTDASDYHLLSGSPAINSGTDVGLTTDFAGHKKCGSAWDIGSYEVYPCGNKWFGKQFPGFPSFPAN